MNISPAKIRANWRVEKVQPGETIPTNNLGSGTADNTTFLRGDQTWVVPPSGGVVTWGSITGLLSNQTDLQTALNLLTPFSRTLTINGTTLDLSANRSWTVGDVLTSGSYPNPSWITTLAWLKITGTPTTLLGYGITDAQPTLVSGTNIKTVGGTSLLGSGDIPVGSTVTPAALTKTDDTNVTLTLTGTPSGALLQATTITVGWTGTLADARITSSATWNAKLSPNIITPATKTKISYDASGLVNAGADATTADIADSSNKRYVTDAQLVVIGNTSGTNTGNETAASIGVIINGSSASTPNDTDLVATAESSVVKKITWTNVKAFLKTYFDTVYTTTSAVATQITTALSPYLTSATAASTYAPIASPTLTGTLTTPAIIISSETASRVAIIDGSKNVKSADTTTYPSLTELSYVKGATSSLQTQITTKQASLGGKLPVFHQSGAAAATTNTTSEEILRSILIPSGTLGNNDCIEVLALFDASGRAGTLNLRIRLHTASAIAGTIYYTSNNMATTVGAARIIQHIAELNATNSQAAAGYITTGYTGGVASVALTTSSLSTAADIYVLITSQKSTGADPSSLVFSQVNITTP